MSRNRAAAYINKIRAIKAPNGYKFDIANYLYNNYFYNSASGYDYPAFVKMINETETRQTFRRVYYIKYWDGTGEYKAEEYIRGKNCRDWQVTKKCTTLEQSNRYSIKKLLTFCN